MNAAFNTLSNFVSYGSEKAGSIVNQSVRPLLGSLASRSSEINQLGITILAVVSVLYLYNRFLLRAKKFSPLKGPWLLSAWVGAFDANHTGTGKKISPLGAIWKGNFVNGWLHGQGKISDGLTIQKGQFDNGRFVNGTITEAPIKKYLFFGEVRSGRTSTGTFYHGILNGQGTRINRDGSTETGMFVMGRMVQGQVS